MTKWYVIFPSHPPPRSSFSSTQSKTTTTHNPASFAYVGETPETRTAGRDAQVANLKDYVNNGGLSRGAIFNAVEASLKRLKMDYIDLLQIHRFDKNTPIEETMKALHDLVQSGKVRYIGAR